MEKGRKWIRKGGERREGRAVGWRRGVRERRRENIMSNSRRGKRRKRNEIRNKGRIG